MINFLRFKTVKTGLPAFILSFYKRIILALLLSVSMGNVFGTTYTVTNLLNTGAGSLRDAITLANANPGLDQIVFNIPGAGPYLIPITSQLTITDAVDIDGSTQPGYAGTPIIEIDGAGFWHFRATGVTGITIQHLNLHENSSRTGSGIWFQDCFETNISNNIITNRQTGIYIDGGRDHIIENNDLTGTSDHISRPQLYLRDIFAGGNINGGVQVSGNTYGGTNVRGGIWIFNMANLLIGDENVIGAHIVIEDASGMNTFDGASSGSDYLLKIQNGSNITIDDVDVSKASGGQDEATGIEFLNAITSIGIQVLNCNASNRDNGIKVSNGKDVTIKNNNLQSSGAAGTHYALFLSDIGSTNFQGGVDVSGNLYGGTDAHNGIYIANMQDLLIGDENIAGANIVVEDASGLNTILSGNALYLLGTLNVTIDNIDVSQVGGSQDGTGIRFVSSLSNFLIQNCTVNNRLTGIFINGGQDFTIKDNDLTGSGASMASAQAALYLQNITENALPKGISVSGNTYGGTTGVMNIRNMRDLLIGDENVVGAHIVIEDNSGANTSTGGSTHNDGILRLDDVSDVVVDNIDASFSTGQSTSSGIVIRNTGLHGNITIQNCNLQHRRNGLYVLGGRDYTIQSNNFDFSGQSTQRAALGIFNVESNLLPGGIMLQQNVFGNANTAIRIDGLSDLVIANSLATNPNANIIIEDGTSGMVSITAYCMYMLDIDGLIMDDVDFSYSAGRVGTGVYLVTDDINKPVTIQNCDFNFRVRGLYVQEGQNVSIHNNDFSNSGSSFQDAALFLNNITNNGLSVHSNTFGGASIVGVGIYNMADLKITNNIGTPGTHIALEDASGLKDVPGSGASNPPLYIQTCSNILVDGLNLSYNPANPWQSSSGIYATLSNEIVIQNCIIGNRYVGIWINSGTDNQVLNNDLRDCGQNTNSPALYLSSIKSTGGLVGGINVAGNLFGTGPAARICHTAVQIAGMSNLNITDGIVGTPNISLEDGPTGVNVASTYPLYLRNVSNVLIDDVDFNRTGSQTGTGLYITNDDDTYNTYTIRNCLSQNRAQGIYISNGKDFTIHNNDLTGSGNSSSSPGLYLTGIVGGALSGGIDVYDNLFGGSNVNTALRVASMQDVIISDGINPNTNIELLDGTSGIDDATGYSIYLNNLANSVLENVVVAYSGAPTQLGTGIYANICNSLEIKDCSAQHRVTGIEGNAGTDYTITGNDLRNSGTNTSNAALELNAISSGLLTGGVSVSGNMFGGTISDAGLRISNMTDLTITDGSGTPNITLANTDGLDNVNDYAIVFQFVSNILIDNVSFSRTGSQSGWGIYVLDNTNNAGVQHGPVTIQNCTIQNRTGGIYAFEGVDYTFQNIDFTGTGLNLSNPAIYMSAVNSNTLPGGLSISGNTFGGTNAHYMYYFQNMSDLIISDGSEPNTNVSLLPGNGMNGLDQTLLYFQNVTDATISSVDLSHSGAGISGIGLNVGNSHRIHIKNNLFDNRTTGLFDNGSSSNLNVLCNTFTNNTRGFTMHSVSFFKVENNVFSGNIISGITNNNASQLIAENNYWGAVDGSSSDGGSGDAHVGNVDALPFLAAPAASCPIVLAEMEVFGNGQLIPDGSITPLLADFTDFEDAVPGSSTKTHSFEILNIGGANLTISAINFTGVAAADFSLSGVSLPATLTPGMSLPFSVTFSPTVAGIRLATIEITNTDADENPYNYDIQGEGIPTIEVTNVNLSGLGSLYEAIVAANANPGVDVIEFNIPGAGPHIIMPNSGATQLPIITEAVIIDGATQPGFVGTPLIQIAQTFDDWIFRANNTTGLVIKNINMSRTGTPTNHIGYGVQLTDCHQSIISDNIIQRRRQAIYQTGGTDITIENNDFAFSSDNTNRPQIYLLNVSASALPGGMFINNNTYGNGVAAIRLDGFSDVTVTNGTVGGSPNIIIPSGTGLTTMSYAPLEFRNGSNLLVDSVNVSWSTNTTRTDNGILATNVHTATFQNLLVRYREIGIDTDRGSDQSFIGNDFLHTGDRDSEPALYIQNLTKNVLPGGLFVNNNVFGNSNSALRITNIPDLIISDGSVVGSHVILPDGTSGFSTVRSIPLFLDNISNYLIDDLDLTYDLGSARLGTGIEISNNADTYGKSTIQNCVIKNRSNGLYIFRGNDFTIVNNDLDLSGQSDGSPAIYLDNLTEDALPGGISMSGNTFGTGGALCLRLDDMADIVITNGSGSPNITLEDVTSQINSRSNILYVNNVNNLLIDNVDFAWTASGTKTGRAVFITNSEDITITNNTINLKNTGLRIQNSQDVTITGNDFTNTSVNESSAAIYLTNVTEKNLSGGVFIDNNIFGGGHTAIRLGTMSDLIITDGLATNPNSNIILPDATSGFDSMVGYVLYMDDMSDILVDNVDAAYAGPGQSGFGFYLHNINDNFKNFIFQNNNLQFRAVGIYIEDGQDAQIINNDFTNTGANQASPALYLIGLIKDLLDGGIFVDNNTFGGTSNMGVRINDMQDLIISDGTILGTNITLPPSLGDVIGNNSDLRGPLYLDNVANVLVQKLTLSYTLGAQANSVGIRVEDSKTVTLRDNTIANRYKGIYAIGGSDIQIINNDLTDCGQGSSNPALYLDNISEELLSGGVFVSQNIFGGSVHTATRITSMEDLIITDGLPTNPNSNVILEDGLTGINTASTYPLYLDDVSAILIDDLDCSRTGSKLGWGIYIDNAASNSDLTIQNCLITNRAVGIYADDGQDYTIINNDLTGCGTQSTTASIHLNSIEEGGIPGGILMQNNTYGGAGSNNGVYISNMRDLIISDGSIGGTHIFLENASGLNSIEGTSSTQCAPLWLVNCSNIQVENVDLSKSSGAQASSAGIIVDNENQYFNITLRGNNASNRIRGIYIEGGRDYRIENNDLTGSGNSDSNPALYLNSINPGNLPSGILASGNLFGGTDANTGIRADLICNLIISDGSVAGTNITIENSSGMNSIGTGTCLYFDQCAGIQVNNVDLSSTGSQMGTGVYITNDYITDTDFQILNNNITNRNRGVYGRLGSDFTIQGNDFRNTGPSGPSSPAIYLESVLERLVPGGILASDNLFGGLNANAGFYLYNMWDLTISDGSVPNSNIILKTTDGIKDIQNDEVLYLDNLQNTLVTNVDLSFSGSTPMGIGLYVTNGEVTAENVTVSKRNQGMSWRGFNDIDNEFTISCNTLFDNNIGMLFQTEPFAYLVENNHLKCNTTGISANFSLLAENNYWGAADGSATDGGSGDTYIGTVDAVPFLVAPNACGPALPTLSVLGNTMLIPDEDTTPQVPDNTEVCSPVGQTAPMVFEITNTGTGVLELNGATPVSLTPIAGVPFPFTIAQQPTKQFLCAGESTTFIIHFTPAATGTYTATVTVDYVDCAPEVPYNFDILGFTGPNITFTAAGTQPSCPNGNDGFITVSSEAGGTPPYTYSSDGGLTYGPSNILGGLEAGSYTVLVKDANGCVSLAQTIVVPAGVDVTPPAISCPADITVSADPGTCTAVVNYTAPVGTDNCPGPITALTAGLGSGATFPIGTTVETYTVTDSAGFTATCSFNVVVTTPNLMVTGNGNPIADGSVSFLTTNQTDFDVIAIGTGGKTFTYILDNSAGNEALVINSISLSNITEFTLGPIPASVPAGATASFDITFDSPVPGVFNSTVTISTNECPNPSYVFDITGEALSCPTISFTATPTASSCPGTTDGQIAFSGVSGGTGPYTYSIDNGISFSSGNPFTGLTDGDYQVMVKDATGCVSAITTVNVPTAVDIVPPVAVCQNITVYLDASGNVSITGAQVDGGSTDNCGIAGLSVAPNSFTCADTGPNTVTLTVSDAAGNNSTCASIVTVVDSTSPTAVCQNITVYLDGSGNASITAAQIDDGSSDNCGVTGLSVTPSAFTCANTGANTVTLTVSDAAGNNSTCTAVVTVNDTISPTISCPADVTVYTGTGPGNGCADLQSIATALDLANHPGTTFPNGPLTPSGTSLTLPTGVTNEVKLVSPIIPPGECFTGQEVTVQFSTTWTLTSVTDNDAQILFSDGTQLNLNGVTFENASIGSIYKETATYSPGATTLTPTFTNLIGCGCWGGVGTQIYLDATMSVSAAGVVTIVGTMSGDGNANLANFSYTYADLFDVSTGINIIIAGEDSPGSLTPQFDLISITCPMPSISLCEAPATFTIPSTDNCPGQTVVCSHPSGSTFPLGTTAVSCTVTDAAGNMASCNFNVVVLDTISPSITCPADITQSNDPGQCSAIVNFNVPTCENCPGETVVCTPASGSVFPVGTTVVNCVVTDASGNTDSCSFNVTVEDTEDPNAVCNNITVYLDGSGNASITAAQVDGGSSDNCAVTGLSVTPNSFTCANTGANTVTLTVSDAAGNSSTCTATVTVNDSTPPTAICQNIDVYLDGSGNASITAAQVDGGSSDNCAVTGLSVTPSSFTCANTGPNTVTLTVTDAAGNSSTCTATVTVNDSTPPTAVCQNITVYLDGSGNASITGAQVDGGSSDNCGVTGLSVTPNTFTCANTGPNTVTLTVSDAAGNSSTCTAVVTVNDSTPPTAVCQNIDVYLDGSGNVSITGTDVDGGSSDNCGVTGLSVSPNSFTCANAGPNTVTLTVTDAAGNSSTCTATVTVNDSTPPTAVCQNIDVYLDGSGNASITAAQVDGGSSDNCGVTGLSVTPNSFTCANTGANTVTLTVTDAAGNSSTCTATVTVNDTISPTALCQNIDVYLDGSGNVSISGADVDGGSSDNCGVTGLSVTPNSFTCANTGPNTVTLTVTDAAGNSSTCTAVVTVNDSTPPIAVCQDVTVYLDGSGNAAITETDVDGGSTDNCGIASLTVMPNTFSCTDLTTTVFMTIDSTSFEEPAAGDNDYNDPTANPNTDHPLPDVAGDPDVNYTSVGGEMGFSSFFYRKATASNGLGDGDIGTRNVTGEVGGSFIDQNQGFKIGDVDGGAVHVTFDAVDISNASNVVFTISMFVANTGYETGNPANSDSIYAGLIFEDASVQHIIRSTGGGAGGSSDMDDMEGQVYHGVTWTEGTWMTFNVNVNPGHTSATLIVAGNSAASFEFFYIDNIKFQGDVTMNSPTTTLIVTDAAGNVDSCSANITVLDTISPTAVCQNIDVYLDGSGNASIAGADVDGGSSDNCGVTGLSVTPNSFTCANTGPNTVTLTVTDAAGNSSTCTATVTVNDSTPPTAVCQNIDVYLDGSGNASITAAQVDGGSSDNCGVTGLSVTPSSFTCANTGANTVTLTVTDAAGNSSTCTATVTVNDSTPPTAVCQNIDVYLDGSGNASITAAQIDGGSSDNCGVTGLSVTPSSFTCANTGANTVTLTVTDAAGNSSTCTATVTVNDSTPPTALCQNIDVYLDGSGNASITAAQVDGGSSDNCGVTGLSVTPSSFTCANTGPNTVTLTVTDAAGNSSTCTATVTVNDSTPPTAVCQNIDVYLDGSGNASITAAQVDGGSSDNCGVTGLSVTPSSFTCANTGPNTVTLTVTDAAGNSSTCTATVTVNDSTPPTALCQNIDVYLDGSGNASITAAQVDGGSSDNCGVTGLSVTPNTFTCANTGANTVTLTVTDAAGNSSTCTATVTVNDTIPPVAVCNDLIIDLGVANPYTLTGADIDAIALGSSDNCPGFTYAITSGQTTYDCDDLGQSFMVVLTVTDASGNTDTCHANVSVTDVTSVCNDPPVAVCQDITVYVDANCTASITPADVDGGSTDPDGDPLTLTLDNSGPFAPGVYMVILTVDDGEFTDTCHANVTVLDSIPPTISCPSNITVNNDPGQCGAVVMYSINPADNCPGFSVAQTNGLPNGALFPVGTTTNAFLVTDAAGNTASCNFTVTVLDVEAPVIDCGPSSPPNMLANPSFETGTIFNVPFFGPGWTPFGPVFGIDGNIIPSAQDGQWYLKLFGGNAGLYQEHPVSPGDNLNATVWLLNASIDPMVAGCVGFIRLAYFDAGNSFISTTESAMLDHTTPLNTWTQIVHNDVAPAGAATVRFIAIMQCTSGGAVFFDNASLINNSVGGFPGNITVDNDPGQCGAVVTFSAPAATDNCGVTSISCVPASGSFFSVGVNTVVCTATDAAGNTDTCHFTITVNDTTPPVAPPPPADVTVECASDVPAPVDLTATDNCDGPITVSPVPVITPGSCPNDFVMVRTWTFTDVAGNTSSVSQTITVSDTTAPATPPAPADVTVECASDVPAPVDLTAIDNCDGPITVSPVPVVTPGSCPNDFVMVRTWTFVDTCGNTSSVSQTITVSDTTAPATPPAPADVTVECASDVPAPVDLTATDNCDGPITVSPAAVITPGSCPNDFVMVRTWTFVDTCGNTSSVSQTITVSDTTAPAAPPAPADVTVECASDVPAPVDLTATDNCDGPITVSPAAVITPGSCPNDFVMVRTWTFVDTCGNTSSVSQTITVSDTTAPAAPPAPADVMVECASDVPAPVDLTATDNCDGPITVSPSALITPGSCPNDFVMVRTWTFVDTCGNTSSVSQTITVSDTTAPVFTCPSDISVAADNACQAMVSYSATALDNCDGTVDVVFSPPSGSIFPIGISTVTATATDTCGNSSTCSFTVTVIDSTAPNAVCQNITVFLDASGNASISAADVDGGSNDNCGIDSLFVIPSSFGCNDVGLNPVTLWVTDLSGNISSCTAMVTVADTVAPIALCQDISILLDSTGNASITPADIDNGSNDACGIASITVFPNSFDCNSTGNNTVTLTVTDVNGNVSTCTANVEVLDLAAPMITCPPDVSVSADLGECFASNVALGSPIVNDNCGNFVVSNNAPVNFPVGTTTVTWTLTDASGNSVSCNQEVLVTDDEDPIISCPADLTIECTESTDPAINLSLGLALASDNCTDSSDIYIEYTDAITPGPCPNNFVINRVWSAIDEAGNFSSCTQLITVEDTQAPVAPNPPADVTVECMDDVPAAAFLMAQDNCDGMIVGVVSDSITPGACVNEFTILRTWLFKDACNNAVTVSQTIVVDDNTAPDAPDLPDLSFQCADDVPLPAGVVTALDNCDGTVVGVLSADTIPGSCVNNFVITRTYTFTDGCGNQSSETQTITVNDDTDPVATCPADVSGLQCGDTPPAAATTIAEFYAMGGTVSDNCSDTSAISISHVDVDNGNTECVSDGIRVITRTYTLTDECGNSTSCSQTFSYDEDTEAPVISCPADESDLDCNYVVPAGATDIASFLALGGTASDNCTATGDLTVSYVDVDNMTLSCPGDARVIVRTYTITDACGNSSTCDQTFTYEEITTPPVIDCPADLVCLCGNPDNPLLISNWLNSVTGASACPLGVTITNNYPNGTFTPDCGNAGTQEVTFTIVDDCGNVDSCTANIIFVDNNPPELDCPAPIIVGTDMGTCEADIQVGEIVIGALDKCDPNFTITNNSPFALDNNSADIAGQYPVGSYQITFTATDACGNVSSCTLDLTVEDDDAPVISCPADITVYADPGECGASVNFNMPSYADNCPGAFLTQVSGMSSGDFFPTGTTVQEYMVIDGKGNTANCSFSITVINTLSSLCTVTGYAPGTPANFALFLNGLPGVSNPNFEWENGSGTLAVFLDGTATLKGKVINKGDPNVAFDVNILLENEMDWATWSALGRGYKANAFNQATADANHPGWTFWELSSSSKLIGSSGSTYDGDVLTLDPKPADYSYGFQLGLGANDKDNDYGISGWYYYSGDLGGQSVSGDGDVNGDASCQANPCGSGIAVAPRTMLEGNYNIGTQLMADNLRQAGLLPLLEPYSGLGFVHVGGGGESTTTAVLSVTGDDAIVDWVVVELRPQGNTSQIAATRSALLQRDGDIVDVDGVSPVSFVDQPEGNYHVAIYHRSHVPIMSEGAFSLLSSAAYLDFADGSVVSYGTNATKTMSGSVEGMYCGDADFDHTISSTDRALLWNYKNQTGYLNVDVDLDGACTASDRSFGWNNRNQVKQF